MAARNKKYFRDKQPELMLYDAAVKDLRAHYGKEKFPSRKQVRNEPAELVQEKNSVYERSCAARTQYRKIQAVRVNFHALQGQDKLERNTVERT